MIGKKIRDLRKKLGLTQEQLAGTELTKSYVSQVELGRIHPSHKALQIIANRLGKPVGYFIENRDDIRTIDVLLKASEALWSSGRLDDGMAGLKEALTLAERIGRDDVLAHIRMVMGQVELLRGNVTEAQAHLEASLKLSRPDESASQAVLSANALGMARARQGSFHKAIQCFQQALDYSRYLGPGEEDIRAEALESYGDFCFAHQQWASALELYREATEPGPVLPALRQTALHVRAASCLWRLNRQEQALAELGLAQHTLGQVTDHEERAKLQLDLARVLTEAGLYEEAERHLAECRPVFQHGGWSDLEAQTLEAQLALAGAAGREDWLARYGQDALARRPEKPWLDARMLAFRLLSRQAVAQGRLQDAESLLLHALKEAPDPAHPWLDCEYHLVRVLQGHPTAAQELWDLMTRTNELSPSFLRTPRIPRPIQVALPH